MGIVARPFVSPWKDARTYSSFCTTSKSPAATGASLSEDSTSISSKEPKPFLTSTNEFWSRFGSKEAGAMIE